MAKNDKIAQTVKKLAQQFEYIRFELPDLHGISRSKLIPIDKVESYARNGLNMYGGTLGLDTASSVVPGCGLNEELNYADSRLFPDFGSFAPVPWKDRMGKVICDAHFLDGSHYEAAPRRVLARMIDEAGKAGLNVLMGHEFEFYLLDGETRKPLFDGLHIFNTTRNDYTDFAQPMLDNLREMGVDVITHNCEYAGSQFEINFGPGSGVAGADKAFTFKNAVKEMSHLQGYLATFMTKPWTDSAGSGCHVHISLSNKRGGANAFSDRKDRGGLSKNGRHFVAGILAHSGAMMALCAPTPNCYHRTKPHTFAPSNVSWGIEDRTALVRIKDPGSDKCHVEMRGASAMSNPYLSAASVLAAGLLGIKHKLKLGPQAEGPSEEDPGLPKLPQSLDESLSALDADEAMCALLGDDFVKLFTTVKRYELARLRGHVTDWERAEYLELY